MADENTPFLNLTKPDVGYSDDTWGGKLNVNFDILDTALSGVNDAISGINSAIEGISGSLGNYVSKSGDTMTGDLTISKNADWARLNLTTTDPGSGAIILGRRNGSLRWAIYMPTNNTETGSSNGSDFWLEAFSDTGASFGTAFVIKRNTRLMSLFGNLNISPPALNSEIVINKPTALHTTRFVGQTNGSDRWHMQFGVSGAESGGNVGANWRLDAYNDAGAFLHAVLSFDRASGLGTLKGEPTAALGIATKSYVDKNSREKLTTTRNYYVGGVGSSDANNGLSDVVGGGNGPWASIQKAIDHVCQNLDCGIYNVVVTVAQFPNGVSGNYGAVNLRTFMGTGIFTFQGTGSIAAGTAPTISGGGVSIGTNAPGSIYSFTNFKLASTALSDVRIEAYTKLILANIDFAGQNTAFRVWCNVMGYVQIGGSNIVSHGPAVSGPTNSAGLMLVEAGGYCYINSASFNYKVSCTYSATLTTRNLGIISANSSTTFPIDGGVTVTATNKYSVSSNSSCSTFGAAASGIPGTGTTVTTGGYFA